MKTNGLLALALFGFSITGAYAAKGGVFVEPMVTYEQGKGKINYKSPINDSTSNMDGFGLGARAGFHVSDIIFIGADGRYSKPTFKDSSFNTKSNAKAWNWGPTLGVQTPTDLGIRVWGTYIVDGQVDPEKDKGIDAKFKDGSGYRLGAGIKLWITSLNLEYQRMTYDTTDVKTNLANFSTKNASLKNNSWILSVSFPIGL
jgi:hypothetical protein